MIDDRNSTTDTLLAGGLFPGNPTEINDTTAMAVMVDTDQDGTLYVECSADDGATWPLASKYTVTGGTSLPVTEPLFGTHYRVRYVNGGTDQTRMKLVTNAHWTRAEPRSNGGAASTAPSSHQGIEVSAGRVPNTSCVHKYGKRAAIGATQAAIWEGTAAQYTGWLTTAQAVRARAGDAADTVAGAGARKALIVGLDADLLPAEAEVDLAGASPSLPTSQTFLRVFRVFVTEVGTYHGDNVGDIVIEETGASAEVAVVKAGEGQTTMAIYTVPANKRGYLLDVDFQAEANAGTDVDFRLYTCPASVSSPLGSRRLRHTIPKLAGPKDKLWVCPVPIEPGTDIWVEAVKANNTAGVSATFAIRLEDV
jgi:hypothetical protein